MFVNNVNISMKKHMLLFVKHAIIHIEKHVFVYNNSLYFERNTHVLFSKHGNISTEQTLFFCQIMQMFL